MNAEDYRHDESRMGRIEAFSDGVFAIAITLLIIEIAVPHVDGGRSLEDALAGLWPSYGAYVLSFVMIGIYWANHHFLCGLFRRSDHFLPDAQRLLPHVHRVLAVSDRCARGISS